MFEWVVEFILFLLMGYCAAFTLVGIVQRGDVGLPKSDKLAIIKATIIVVGIFSFSIFSIIAEYFWRLTDIPFYWDGILYRSFEVYKYTWPLNAHWFFLTFVAGIFEEIYYAFRDNFGSN